MSCLLPAFLSFQLNKTLEAKSSPKSTGWGWHQPMTTHLSKTTSWAEAQRLQWQGSQWARQGQAGMTLALVIEATGLAITGTLLKLPSPHFRASHFNLPKWQTAIIFKMTFIPV